MKLITDPKKLRREFSRLLGRYEKVSFAAAWASFGFPPCEQLIANRHKIGRGVVGIHFYQTDPDFIEAFMNDERVRFVQQPDGTFHPKFYLFENSGSEWACLLGSANFTHAAFTANSEATVLFDSEDGPLAEMKADLDGALSGYWETLAKPFDPVRLPHYKSLWNSFRQRRKPMAGDFGGRSSEKDMPSIDGMSWDEFLSMVLKDQYHAIDLRIDVLEKARGLFERHKTFGNMSAEERRGIAGFRREVGVHWGWFGSMVGAGTFKNRVNENDPNLSRALDAIPLEGAVTRENYIAYIESFKKAFPGDRGHGLATATRLLCMKRPDYFLCLDSANLHEIRNRFGLIGDIDYDRYWDAIIARILEATWWKSAPPEANQALGIWKGRVAFLDSLSYHPTEKVNEDD